MLRIRRSPGWANPRARAFMGGKVFWTKLHQLYGAKVGQRRARRNQGDLKAFPPILQLQTRTGCNASCVICPQSRIKNDFPEEAMSDELYRSLVEQCRHQKNLHGVGFVLHNEPLLDTTLPEKIRLFRERGPEQAMTFLVTNGTLLTPKMADRLLDSGLDALHISCNGYGREDYEAVNQGKSWDEFRANLDSFLARDLSQTAVLLSFVRSRLYREEMEKAIREWKARGIYSYVHGINNRGGMVEDYEKFAIPLEQEAWPLRARKKVVKRFLGCCPYPFLQMSVLANGQVLICTHDWARRQVVGDLKHQTILEAWNGPEMRAARLHLLSGRADLNFACSR